MRTMDGGKREVFDIRALTAPPMCRYVLMVAWSDVEVNYLRGSTAWGLACPFVAASRGNARVTTKMGGVVAGEAWGVGPATAANWEAMVYSPV
jgi:hypothetical protein